MLWAIAFASLQTEAKTRGKQTSNLRGAKKASQIFDYREDCEVKRDDKTSFWSLTTVGLTSYAATPRDHTEIQRHTNTTNPP